MKIIIKTRIAKNFQLLYPKFNRDLFSKLKAPFLKISLERFDGCLVGHEVHVRLEFFGKKELWVSRISENVKGDYEIFFTDIGTTLPRPLKKWKHVHRIQKINELDSYIIDDIEFTTGNKMLDLAIYPTLYSLFLYRVPIYKRELE